MGVYGAKHPNLFNSLAHSDEKISFLLRVRYRLEISSEEKNTRTVHFLTGSQYARTSSLVDTRSTSLKTEPQLN